MAATHTPAAPLLNPEQVITDRPIPKLVIAINGWTLVGQPSPERVWSLEERLDAVLEAGFDAYSSLPDEPGLAEAIAARGMRFGGVLIASSPDQLSHQIRENLDIGDGPINCHLADHDTPIEEAIDLGVALMEEAERQGAAVYIEVHRDTSTETPEKTSAIAEGVKRKRGRYPLVNFDFSHPAIVKHLYEGNYVDRLFDNVELFQQASLWHMRPFNGHHCQIPVTDGKGEFSPEYKEMRVFIRHALEYWLQGPRPGNELWVVPELGPKSVGYGLSCFPNIWQDAIVLGHDIRTIWSEIISDQVSRTV